jgi:Fe-S-cluster containining protein
MQQQPWTKPNEPNAGTQYQPGSETVAVERTCDGRCCAVFPLSRSPEEMLKGSHYDAIFVGDMVIALTPFEARRRWADLGYGELKDLDLGQPLYTCRHWDTATKLCTVYDERPWLCRDFPYALSCHHTGCTYRKSIDYYVDVANRNWESLKAWDAEHDA